MELAMFQSKRPTWGATARLCSDSRSCFVSIHAPHVGRDIASPPLTFQGTAFQSTRPTWGATTMAPPTDPTSPFQSTRPTWGATGVKFEALGNMPVSIHAPHVGRD